MADDNDTRERGPLTPVADGPVNPAPTQAQADERNREIEERMAAQGASLTESGQADYFGFEEVHRVFLPDNKSYVEHKLLTEGGRRKYLNKVNREVRLQRSSGDATINTAPGDERKALLEAAICGWNLVRADGKPVEFKAGTLTTWLDVADPKVVEIVEKDIRLKNPWLLQEMSIEDIDKEIATLQEMREEKVKQEEAKNA